jgi:D-alanyl-D-alanine dipeptidase
MSKYEDQSFGEIPSLRPLRWEEIFKVPIRESGEKLVPVSLYPERILARSIYYQQGYAAAFPEVYLREGVYECLIRAAEALPGGYKLVVYDGWRPVPLQLSLFEEYVAELADCHPGKDQEELKRLASMYVAAPSSDPRRPSPHSTGASVDLTIVDEMGRLLPMGGGFDEKSERSETHFYEKPEADPAIQRNRRLLYHVMTGAGFTNYPEEWWHYDCGNQNWVYFSGKDAEGIEARYGIVGPSESGFSLR